MISFTPLERQPLQISSQTVVSTENPPNPETFIEEFEPPIMGDRLLVEQLSFPPPAVPHLIPSWPPPEIGQRDALILCIGELHCSSVKPRSTTSGSQTYFKPLDQRLESWDPLRRTCSSLPFIAPLALSCRSVTRAVFFIVGFLVSGAHEVNIVLLVSSTIICPSFDLDFNSYGKCKVQMVEPKFKMTLAELLDESKVVSISVCGNLEVEITRIQHDSRFVSSGELFVCCVGMKIDGQLYLSEVDKKGVVAMVASKDIDIDETLGCKALVILEDTNSVFPCIGCIILPESI
ncbi:hypothetical protein NE237_017394 [Protea cynaroides]|uniref:Mur ligase N-terminal catalytic domain-containing protein n=1 Tax=Protea cynaroides TaxID=273540 RepID=A0A9Q0QMV4_9MAGN|nr:hypothetical protein NE237_017394 [Protea cynaroides]